jgi:hypothetical protein
MSAFRLRIDVDQCDGFPSCASCSMNNPAANLDADNRGTGPEPSNVTSIAKSPACRSIESCERELVQYRAMEIRLRDALAESEERLRQKDELIQKQALLKRESDHRLLNDLQMTISLLSMQSRAAANPEAAAQLTVAANRVAMIARIHHRLNSYEGVQTIEFTKFLGDLSRDFVAMVSTDECPEQIIVEGSEMYLPATTAIPLGQSMARAGLLSGCSSIRNLAARCRSRMTARLCRKVLIPAPARGWGCGSFNRSRDRSAAR